MHKEVYYFRVVYLTWIFCFKDDAFVSEGSKGKLIEWSEILVFYIFIVNNCRTNGWVNVHENSKILARVIFYVWCIILGLNTYSWLKYLLFVHLYRLFNCHFDLPIHPSTLPMFIHVNCNTFLFILGAVLPKAWQILFNSSSKCVKFFNAHLN